MVTREYIHNPLCNEQIVDVKKKKLLVIPRELPEGKPILFVPGYIVRNYEKYYSTGEKVKVSEVKIISSNERKRVEKILKQQFKNIEEIIFYE
ncbi:MAG: hypothetical protein QXL88_01970 [Candidatus Pacearchaeota archaeon]